MRHHLALIIASIITIAALLLGGNGMGKYRDSRMRRLQFMIITIKYFEKYYIVGDFRWTLRLRVDACGACFVTKCCH